MLGKDPQSDHMDDYVDTTDDNGGVHINSGIPNRAFHLAATAIGGSSAEGAGQIWYAALTGGRSRRTDFAAFAAATVAAAGEHADAGRGGVGRPSASTLGHRPAGPGEPPRRDRRRAAGAACRRTGGFAGLRADGEVDLDADDPRAPELADLVDRIDLRAVAGGDPRPDMYVYAFDLCGDQRHRPRAAPHADLRRVAELVLVVRRRDSHGRSAGPNGIRPAKRP